MFVLPVLTYTAPHAAADALRWRQQTLELARERARDLGLKGAAFPWRTIAGPGVLELLAGRYRRVPHQRRHRARGDPLSVGRPTTRSSSATTGAELLVETARLWRSLGHHDAAGKFRIDGVTGPDEYSAVADNNIFTNLMAQQNLNAAAEIVERHPQRASELGVDAEEAAGWRDAAARMTIPYNELLEVHEQAEGFTSHDVWDFESCPEDQYPLLLHFPYFDLYRKQVVKQADLVLALYECGHAFTDSEKGRDFEYYERL